MHLLDATFPAEIRRPIGYTPDTEYQFRAIRIFLAFDRLPYESHPSIKNRNLALAWESALFMGDY